MKCLLIVMALLISLTNCVAQVTDSHIIHALLGKNVLATNKTLDSLGIWYHLHMYKLDKTEDAKKIYSISDSKGCVKVYSLKLKKANFIEEIIVNYRHDSKEQKRML